jgi:predicted nucleotidyltransferase
MRISSNEILKIKNILNIFLTGIDYKIYLFGSRADDNKKGGDIDLLLFVNAVDFETVYSKKPILKFELETILGDQKVDLTLTTEEKKQQDLFIDTIFEKAIEL